MSKKIFLISGIVFVLAGLFFLVTPFATLENWGIVVGGRVGNIIIGIAGILIGGVLTYLSFRKGRGAGVTPTTPVPTTPTTPATPAGPNVFTPTSPETPATPAPVAPEAPKPTPPTPPAQ